MSKLSLRRALPLIGILAVSVLGFVLARPYLDLETLAANREALIAWRDANYALAAVVYMLAYIAVVAFSLPGGLIMTLVGGFLFGLGAGVAMIVVSATIGATIIFLAARWGLGDALAARMDASAGRIAKLRAALAQNEVSVLFLIRLVPAIPFFVANVLPALVGVKTRNYVLTTFLGIIPGTAVYTWVGAGLGEVLARGERPNLGLIFEWHILGPLLGLAALSALPIALRALRGRKEAVL